MRTDPDGTPGAGAFAIPEHTIERRRVAELLPADYNPRKITPEALRGLQASMTRYGLLQLIVENRRTGRVVGGHQRLKILLAAGVEEIPVIVVDVDEADEKAMNAVLNSPHVAGEFVHDQLLAMLDEVRAAMPQAFEDLRLAELRAEAQTALANAKRTNRNSDGGNDGLTDPNAIPTRSKVEIARRGEVWLLGEHRVMCGDSTVPDDVARLFGPHKSAPFLHADPPYGMGKEADGVANDNLYGPKLDAFQMAWWKAWRPHLADNASAFVWGNPLDLWRWWWTSMVPWANDAGEVLELRNEVVWDKGNAQGMGSADMRCYPPSTERALFWMLGEQGFGLLNKDDYWEGYEPLRLWMVAQRDMNGWTNKTVNGITRSHMAGHWFTRSQFQIMSRDRYDQLRDAAEHDDLPVFRVPYEMMGGEVESIRSDGNKYIRGLAEQFRATRAHFDNHELMTDVWRYDRVDGAERHGHATPKPVEMIVRAVKASTPPRGAVAEPFGGSGSTLIATEKAGRIAVVMELVPTWVDVIVRRWQAFTGQAALLEGADGYTFAEAETERGGLE